MESLSRLSKIPQLLKPFHCMNNLASLLAYHRHLFITSEGYWVSSRRWKNEKRRGLVCGDSGTLSQGAVASSIFSFLLGLLVYATTFLASLLRT